MRAFADIDDYIARYGEVDDVEALSACLMDASRVIASELDTHGIDWRDPDEEQADRLMMVCRDMAHRAVQVDVSETDIPVGATQYTLSANGFSEYSAFPGGGYGDVYMTRMERRLLGIRQRIGTVYPYPLRGKGCRHARR